MNNPIFFRRSNYLLAVLATVIPLIASAVLLTALPPTKVLANEMTAQELESWNQIMAFAAAAQAPSAFTDSGQALGNSDTRAIPMGDLDGDGDLDALAGNFDGANMVWINQGGKQGGIPGEYASSGQTLGSGPTWAAALGDLDGDGDLDAFIGNTSTTPNEVWLNDGDANFIQFDTLGNSSTAAVSLGDLDGDGDLDAFVGNIKSSNEIWINQGRAQGGTPATFLMSQTAGGSTHTRAASLGDLDGDGDLDAFIGNVNYYEEVWINQGGAQSGTPGVFANSGQFLDYLDFTDGYWDDTWAISLGDLDSDGDLDAYAGNFSVPSIPEDQRQSQCDYCHYAGQHPWDTFTNRGPQPNVVWTNQGGMQGGTPGTFLATQAMTSPTTWAVTLGDVDGDNDLDVLTGECCSNPNLLWVNNGSGAFSQNSEVFGSGDTRAVSMGDVDGDGDLDLFAGNCCSQPNRVWHNTGGGNFNLKQSFGVDATQSLALGDLDSDGDLDLFAGNTLTNSVWLNDSGGKFIATSQFFSAADTQAIALGDLNGDSTLDAFAGNNGSNTVWFNAGTSNFTDSGQTLGSANTKAVALGDLDGDGDLDGFAGNVSDPNQVWINQGGTFINGQTFGSADTQAVALGDLDRDGDLDVLIGNASSQPNQVWFNNGDATFSDSGQALGSANTQAAALGDLDGDGDLDAFIGNNYGPNRVWFNLGSGNFIDSGQALGNEFTWTLALADLDRDGDLDALIGNAFDQPNQIWLNNGNGIFVDTRQALGNSDTRSAILGDLDGDGDLDAVFGNDGNISSQPNEVFLWKDTREQFLQVTLQKPGTPPDANYYSGSEIIQDQIIPVTYTLYNAGSAPISRVEAFYSIDGGGKWLPAKTATNPPSIIVSEGTALAFDGLDDSVVIDPVTMPTTEMTLSFWMRADDTANQGTPVSYGYGTTGTEANEIIIFDYNSISVYIGGVGVNSGVSANDGQWHHITTTWRSSDGEVKLYKDGVLAYTGSISAGHSIAPGGALVLGQEQDIRGGNFSPAQAFKGSMYEVRIWDMVRSQAQIASDMNNSLDGNTPGLTGYWRLDENAGSTAFDQTPNQAHGRLGNSITANKPKWVNTTLLEDFDPLSLGQWNSIIGGTVTKGVCGSVSGSAINFNGAITRTATTQKIDVSQGGAIQFALIIGDINNPSTCESVEPGFNEDIVLEYSTDNGSNWNNIATYTAGDYTNFSPVSVPVPPTAQTTGTQFRWRQPLNSGSCCDHWALDNVAVVHNQVYYWDTFSSGFFGQSDNVVLRFTTFPQPIPTGTAETYAYYDSTAGPFWWTNGATGTFPFRVRGTQVKVVNTNGSPAANAIVYQLKTGQPAGALPIGGVDHPFHTAQTGYLEGRGELNAGDQLVALHPISYTQNYTLYHTSATPTLNGLDMFNVSPPGIQELTVSANKPLLLFNLDLSLEWDARSDPTFLADLETGLQQASAVLYDVSNGQVALGDVAVYHNKQNWLSADIVMYARNNIRPRANQGGVVETATDDTGLSGPIENAFLPGQVSIGPIWDPFGESQFDFGQDWWRTLAHELAHYLLFLPDNYLGIDQTGLVGLDCQGSFMTNATDDSYSELLTPTQWNADPKCLASVAETTTGRSDWETVTKFYTMLSGSGGNAGPNILPLAVTRVNYMDPGALAKVLTTRNYDIRDGNTGQIILAPLAQGYLIHTQETPNDLTDDTLVNLGTTRSGGDRVKVRGAEPGDRVCIFDLQNAAPRLGCEDVTLTSSAIHLTETPGWQPEILVTPVSSTTLQVFVTLPQNTNSLMLQVYPTTGDPNNPNDPITAPTASMTTSDNRTFQKTVVLPFPTFTGYVRVWVPGASPEQMAVTEFTLDIKAWGGNFRAWSGGNFRAWSGAPSVSSDGQLTILNLEDPYGDNGVSTLQIVGTTPGLPNWLTPVGQAYQVTMQSGFNAATQRSLSFDYLQRDVPDGHEADLSIYYYSTGGSAWQRLTTTLDLDENRAATRLPSSGSGLYALVVTVELPAFSTGWNNFGYPINETRPVSQALSSIATEYTSVFYYDNPTDTWLLYDTTVSPLFAPLVNTLSNLEFGRGYWLYATQNITGYLGIETRAPAAPPPDQIPAAYYGTLDSSNGFTPQAGMVIEAYLGNTSCGSSTILNYNNSLAFSLLVRPDTAPGCGLANAALTFRVAGRVMIPQLTWDNSQAHFVTLATDKLKLYLPSINR